MGKKVLMRVDFNVPLNSQGEITNDSRIKASLPSIRYVLDHGGALILMSHLGRPTGPTPKLSLTPCAEKLAALLNKPVKMAADCVGSNVLKMSQELKPGEVLLLENLRFHEAEEHPEKDPEFAKQLASLGDIYVNDAFATAHRAHSSTVEVAKYFPECAASGFLMQKEILFLGDLLKEPKRPFYAIIGGAKVSSKIGILKALLNKVDALLIGGAMAYTFYKAEGIPIGASLHEDNLINDAKEILQMGKSLNVKIFLPQDNVVVEHLDNDAPSKIIESNQGIPEGWQGVDIGPNTIKQYAELLQNGGTVFWNGPMGVFEMKSFAKGTNAIAQTLAQIKGRTVVGGGESVAAVEAAGVSDKFTHISTGGGAALEFIDFGSLPGIDVLTNVENTVVDK